MAAMRNPADDTPFDLADEIACVDDDKLTIEIVSWILRKSEHTSHLFTDPVQAMVHLRNSPPKLLILDFYLPGTTGIELATELRRDERYADCKIYLCSALPPTVKPTEEMARLDLELLEKHVVCEPRLLLELVERHLGGSSQSCR